MTNFVPASDATELTKRTAGALVAVSSLMEMVVNELPPEKIASLDALFNGGGRLGLEFTVDRAATNRVALVAIEREGQHRTLATIAMPAVSPTAH